MSSSSLPEASGTEKRGRRWYHLRPEPRRRGDFMGFSSTWWGMALGWLVVILALLFPFPWWW